MSFTIIISVIIFSITYIGILYRRINRTTAVLTGAMGMIVLGNLMGFYNEGSAINYIDFNTVGLLMGMMILVGILGDSGFFEYLAIITAKLSKGSYYRLLALFILVTGFASAFLDNVTTILLMAPVTITIAKKLEITPIPFLIGESISAHIGGTATLIGDPPNIIIGSQANIDFIDFIIYQGPIVLIVLFVTLLIFELILKNMINEDMKNFDEIMKMDESEAIYDWKLLKKTLAVLIFTMCLFMVHHVLHMAPWVVAMLGATLLLLISFQSPTHAFNHIHWSTILFLVGLFILIGGLDEAGFIDLIAKGMEYASSGNLVIALFIILMVGGAFSIIIGNLPATITLVPTIIIFIESSGLGEGYVVNPLWWALSLAVCFGSNGTLISAPANLIVADISKKMGYPMSFKDFTKISLPVTIFSLLLSFFLLWLFFIVILG